MFWSSTLRMTWATLVMIVGPPGVPTTICRLPALSSTIDGVMADSIRLLPATALASPCTSPYMFGLPGAVAKSSISLLSRNRSEEHTSELQSQFHLVCRLLLEKKKKNILESYFGIRKIEMIQC